MIEKRRKIKIDNFFENKFQELKYRNFILFFFLFNVVLLVISYHHPIGDFGNYYYGSKFFREGITPLKFYQDIHFFNTEIRKHETRTFFENYTPVPPLSLLIYWPFTFLKSIVAKFVFSLICLVIFCFSFTRLIKKLKIISWSFYVLPFIFLQPLYSNFHQGQTYLLIAALLAEFYIALQDDKKIRIGIIIAVLFSLKIFPAFIAIIFIFKKDWKTVSWIILFTLVLQMLVFICIGKEVIIYYYQTVFPRLLMNDVTQPFSYLNQSFYTFLLNGFVVHPYLNPSPFVSAPLIAVIFQLIFYSFIFSAFTAIVSKQKTNISFFFLILMLALVNKYSTVYGLIILFPFIFFLKEVPIKKAAIICILIFLICNIPVYKLAGFPLVLQYSRFWLLLILFVLLLFSFKIKFNANYFGVCLFIFLIPSLGFYNYKTDPGEKEFRPKKGVVYNFNVTPTQLKLNVCLGERDTIETINFISATIDSTSIKNNTSFNSKSVLVNSTQHIELTDINNGVGIYYLASKPLPAN